MSLTADQIDQLARRLDDALRETREVARLTEDTPNLTVTDAYRITLAGLRLREARGERVAAWKMGLTSAAKRAQMNLDSAIWGVLTDAMLVPNHGQVRAADGVHPKIEPEIALRLGAPLAGTVTHAQAWAAVDGVAGALEILDSRYVGFKYFSLPDVIADNASSWRFVLGPWHAPLDVADLPMTMAVNGQPVQTGSSAAISGHPVESLVQLAALLAEVGLSLPAGTVVMTGAATLAEPIAPGMRVTLHVPGLDDVQVDIA